MKDVAARAGVSPTVVSRVLHEKALAIRVSEATALRVKQAAKELGYRVNIMARNFREGQTMMIGVLHGVGFQRPSFRGYFAPLMDGIVDQSFEYGYSVTLCPKLFSEHPESAMSDGRFDGLVWYNTHNGETERELLKHCQVPIVLIHTPAEVFENRFPSVICDNMGGVGLAVEHLVWLGHQRIAFVFGSLDNFGETKLREDAFFEHKTRLGLPCYPSDSIDLDTPSEMERLFVAGAYSAVVCVSDALAERVLKLAPSYGVEVPCDLSVVGFDSTDLCDSLRPRLTSVSQPLIELGRRAADVLVRRIRGEETENASIILSCGLDIRESTSVCRSQA